MDKTTDLARIDEHEKELNKLRAQYGWLHVTRVKLLMDLVFVCAYFSSMCGIDLRVSTLTRTRVTPYSIRLVQVQARKG